MRARRPARGAAALALAALVGACVAGPVERRAPAAAAPAPASTPAAAPATPVVAAPRDATPAPSAASASAPMSTSVASAPPAADTPSRDTVSATPTEPGADVARLQGMTPDALRGFLGNPDFRRRDGQAEIWQYAHDDCILHVILYPSPTGLTVQHVDGRGRTRAALQWVNTRNCYARVMDLRKVSPAS